MRQKVQLVLISALFLTAIFHKQNLGLNLFIAETAFLVFLWISKEFYIKNKNHLLFGLVFFISSLFTILTHSVFVFIMNFTGLFVLTGVILYPEARSLLSVYGISLNHIFESQRRFFNDVSSITIGGKSIGINFRKTAIFILPIIIILVFLLIYRLSNPVFDGFMKDLIEFINQGFTYFFNLFDALIIITFIVSLLISNFLFFRSSNRRIENYDSQSDSDLKRVRCKNHKNSMRLLLKNEYQAAIFLLLVLNILLLIVNIIDINWVWFNFKWEGQYLKQFVHEGTYLLILSILISITIVLYFFRGNLNFYSRNRNLKYLSYLWLAQNGILTISVALRNFYYIQHFNLAYKRIGVLIFLLLTLYGLFTVFVKVKERKSAFFLFKTNTLAFYLVLTLCSFVNWDSLIARYNFSHADRAFVHLNYLSTLSDKALPYLDKTIPELNKINQIQESTFSFEERFMTPQEFHDSIQIRKTEFVKNWKKRSVLSWNLPEYLAFKKLKQTETKE